MIELLNKWSGVREMFSLSQVAQRLGKPYHWVKYMVNTRRLGSRVGRAIILNNNDVRVLEEVKHANGTA